MAGAGGFGRHRPDYTPFPSPEAIATASQLVVQGTVQGLREGRAGTGINSVVLMLTGERASGKIDDTLPGGNLIRGWASLPCEARISGKEGGWSRRSPEPLIFARYFEPGNRRRGTPIPCPDPLPGLGAEGGRFGEGHRQAGSADAETEVIVRKAPACWNCRTE